MVQGAIGTLHTGQEACNDDRTLDILYAPLWHHETGRPQSPKDRKDR